MNVSYKWLKEYVDFDLTPEELSELLTSIGLETGSVERVESIRGGLAGIVIGKVLTCDIHPDSDHLHITTVDLSGDGTPTQIVCGAPNVAAGQTVVVATVGTTLYTPEGEEFKIKKSKIRGVESFGMICAEDEIGVGTSSCRQPPRKWWVAPPPNISALKTILFSKSTSPPTASTPRATTAWHATLPQPSPAAEYRQLPHTNLR